MEALSTPLLPDAALDAQSLPDVELNRESKAATFPPGSSSVPHGSAPPANAQQAAGLGAVTPGRFRRKHVRAVSMPGAEAASWWTEKVKGTLHHTQTALLHQTEDRHAMYSAKATSVAPENSRHPPRPPSMAESPAVKSTTTSERRNSSVSSSPESRRSGAKGRPITRSKTTQPEIIFSKRARAMSADESFTSLHSTRRQALLDRLGSTVKQGIAYMGVDWYEVTERQKRLSFLFLIENLYFWCYAGYIMVTVLLGAVAMWALEPDGRLSFVQCVYSAAACVSQSGLAVTDWSKQAQSTYVVSFLLIIAGSASLLHMAPVLLRRLSFRMQTRLTQRLMDQRISDTGRLNSSGAPGEYHDRRFRRATSDPGVYYPDASAGSDEAVKDGQLPGKSADEPPIRAGQRRDGCSNALSEMHRLEYKALGKVLKIMVGYWLTVHAIGWLIFFSYFEFGSGPIQDTFRDQGLRSDWHAAYLTVSAFQNNGLVMTPSSVMDFRWSPLLLNTIGALVLLGNTFLPIAVRLIAWWLARHSRPGSERERVLDFLLEHPRRCFTHMFPAVHTLWLLLVAAGLITLQTVVMLWQDSDGKAFMWTDPASGTVKQLSSADRLWNSFFQAVSTRTAGLNSVNIADLSQGTTFLMVVMMYFSTTPTVVTMRHSTAELDITGRAEGVEEQVLLGDNSLRGQARRYLTQDITYLVFILFLICVFEKHNFTVSAKDISPESDGVYNDFSFFKVLFEMVSAYGTCGFSLGYRNQTMSFSGMWSTPSQYLLVVVMILGRLRGLPDSIDPSVRVAMGHGEHTEHAFLHA